MAEPPCRGCHSFESTRSPKLLSPRSPAHITRSAALSRQTSFEYEGEERLSSTQVKQHLKAHLLSRQKRAVSGSHRSSSSSTVAAAGADFSCLRPGKRRAVYAKQGQWHSADAACSLSSSMDLVEQTCGLLLKDDRSDARLSAMIPLGQRDGQFSSSNGRKFSLPVNSFNPVPPTLSTVSIKAKDIHQSGSELSSDQHQLSTLNTLAQLLFQNRLNQAGENYSVSGVPKSTSVPNLITADYTYPLHTASRLLTGIDILNLSNPVSTGNTVTLPAPPPQRPPLYHIPLTPWFKSGTNSNFPLRNVTSAGSSSVFCTSSPYPLQTSITTSRTMAPVHLSTLCEQRSVCCESSASSNSDGISQSSKRQSGSSTIAMEEEAISSPPCLVFDSPSHHLSSKIDVQPTFMEELPVGQASSVQSAHSRRMNSFQIGASSYQSTGSSVGSPTLVQLLTSWTTQEVEDWSSLLNPPTTDIDSTCQMDNTDGQNKPFLTTAIAFDPDMLKHECLCSNSFDSNQHPEGPQRLELSLQALSCTCLQIPTSLSFTCSQLVRLLQAAVSTDDPDLQRRLGEFTDLDPVYLQPLFSHVPLLSFCRRIRARMATEDELCCFHSDEHVFTFGGSHKLSIPTSPTVASKAYRTRTLSATDDDGDRTNVDTSNNNYYSTSRSIIGHRTSAMSIESKLLLKLCTLSCGGVGVDSDTVWNPETTGRAARLAAGQVLCLTHKVARREIRNGFALVRPPGHHAETVQAMGFCYFNSVAVSALHLLRHNPSISRVLILDWDIHHGNGTKLATVKHPGIVYISLHRYDGGTFFPGTGPVEDGFVTEDSSDFGQSKLDQLSTSARLINVAWETPKNKTISSCHVCGNLVETSATDNISTVAPSKYHSGQATLKAEDRREMWHQRHGRRSPSRSMAPTREVFCQSPDDSLSSDSPRFICPGPNHRMGSTASSHLCSSCSCSSQSRSSSLYHSHGCETSSSLSSSCCHHPVLHPHESVPQTVPPAAAASAPTPLLGLSDAEYLAAVRCVVLPIANEFQPDIILISAGFDAATGHDEALGGYSVSPHLFAWITRQCMAVSNGRIVLALEGGYSPSVVAECTTACLNSLLLPEPYEPWSPNLSSNIPGGSGSSMAAAEEDEMDNSFDAKLNYPVTNRSSADMPNLHGSWDGNGDANGDKGLTDAWLSAYDWISRAELERRPRAEAVANILATIRHHSTTGWNCFSNVSQENVALSFAEAVYLQKSLSSSSQSSVKEELHSEQILEMKQSWLSNRISSHVTSPLTDHMAQLKMDQT